MKHINADQLRQYKFGLLSETEAAETAAHLEACDACRQKFQALEKQFQALEVLRDQPEVSEETLEAVLAKGRASKVITFRPVAIRQWKPALATAALLAICFAVLKYAPSEPGTEKDEVRRDTAMESVPADSLMVAEAAPAKEERASGDPLVASRFRTEFQDANDPISHLHKCEINELRSKKPFAPASNIELNVLPRRDEVQVTIYNEEDLTLVREKRKLTLKRGWNWLQFMWSNTLIDPTSLELEPKTHADQIEITQLVYPPRLNELARWTIFSEISGEAEFELTYFTSGLKWNAFYEATLTPDEQTIQITSYVRVDNGSGEDYEDAQTRLVVGKINMVEAISELARKRAYYNPDWGALWKVGEKLERLQLELPKAGFAGCPKSFSSGGTMEDQDKKQILKQGLSEHQLYTIEGRETIPNGWGKRLPSFEAHEIGVTNLYKYDEERWGTQTMRFLSFANRKEHKLGETPLPNGRMRVFAQGREGSPSRPGGALGDRALPLRYIGASDIKYIPIGKKVELELGATQKVKVEPKLMRTRTENFEFDSKGNISGWDEITDWEMELTNTRSLPVEIEITRTTGSKYWKISTGSTYEKYDANHVRFRVRLEPGSKQEIEYELAVFHGTRTEK